MDAVVILNILEHIEQDALALQQIWRILKPQGLLIIEVPAAPHLYDIYDKILLHHRRYSLKKLCYLATQAGFKNIKKSHLGFFIYPGFWWVKKRNQHFHSTNPLTQKQRVKENIQSTKRQHWLHYVMKLELALGKIVSYPFGIRCLMTCQKKD